MRQLHGLKSCSSSSSICPPAPRGLSLWVKVRCSLSPAFPEFVGEGNLRPGASSAGAPRSGGCCKSLFGLERPVGLRLIADMANFRGFRRAVIVVVLCICHVNVVRGQSTDPAEVNALRAIKGRLIDPMNNLKNWNSGDPCTSSWKGVFCDNIPINNYLHVTELQLFKMNLSGTLAPEIGLLSQLKTLDFMWNNLTGNIPKEIGNIHTLRLITLNGNQLSGSLPDEIGYLQNLNRLQIDQNEISGPIPKSFANLTSMRHLDLSWNQLTGSIPTNKLASNVTTMDFQNNSLGNIPAAFEPPEEVTILLYGNPVCTNSTPARAARLCQPTSVTEAPSGQGSQVSINCSPCPTDKNYEYNPSSPLPCFCAVPLGVGFRLKSPGISDFRPYKEDFQKNLAHLLVLADYQIYMERYIWEVGPRLNMHLKLFPNNTNLFNTSEVVRLRHLLAGWEITLSNVFGPYELLNFTLGSYEDEFPTVASSGLKRGALAVLSRYSVKVDGVRCFTFDEMAAATNDFTDSAQVGQGGYGKVYKGNLTDGTAVAIKRAHEGSLQGSKEFCTEIELLSRLHHRNLVSLVGYCDEEDEQMLVYEFMPNGTLRDHLSAKSRRPLNFSQRIHIALGAAKGILYLHTEADPPIFHRDVKASNILLDSKFVAKVADFGLSRLAPVPDVDGTMPAHISTVVKGTPGYLDPEYFLTHKLTDKSDVYSLGVVLLELLTGMKPIQHGKNIVREVNTAYQSGEIAGVIDERISSSSSPECVARLASLAVKCCKDETDARPSMADVVRELDAIRSALPEGEELLPEYGDQSATSTSLTATGPLSSSSTTGALFISSGSGGHANSKSGIPSGTVAPR
uniref:non-specific serine/threonine protein kinase n=1 Tax=Oryza rufipogon TaxID=4529 RepID=A0A0E0N456_ORYRU